MAQAVRSEATGVEAAAGERYLLLADISGYTGFMSGVEEEHGVDFSGGIPAAYSVLGDLLGRRRRRRQAGSRAGQARRRRRLRGRAGWPVSTARAIVSSRRSTATYRSFIEARTRAIPANDHLCIACPAVAHLDLKVVLHRGQAVRQSVGSGSDLLGPAVTVAHRLLKNTVRDRIGARPYLFMTDAAATGLGLQGIGLGAWRGLRRTPGGSRVASSSSGRQRPEPADSVFPAERDGSTRGFVYRHMDGLQVIPASPGAADVAALEDGDALTPTLVAVETSANETFEAIYEANFRAVYRYALLATRRSVDAEDVVSDTFARALRAWTRGHGPAGRPLPWLLLICRRIMTDRWRRQRLIGWLPMVPSGRPGSDGDCRSRRRPRGRRRRLPSARVLALARLGDQGASPPTT